MKPSSVFEPAIWGLAAAACALVLCVACEPKLVVGKWSCPGDGGEGGGDGGVPIPFTPVRMPWSTSFEREFCDYTRIEGFCYAQEGGSYSIVESPTHSGKLAAAFHIGGRGQARCVTQGEFPEEAYYSAWYLLPEFVTNTGNWNLLHYRGGVPPNNLHGIWNVSVASESNGELRLYVFRELTEREPELDAFPSIPIGSWFHIEVFFRRAADATGELAVYQDERLVYRSTDIVTDDTTWGQWYVGNLANSPMPFDSTVYVDDVTFRATR